MAKGNDKQRKAMFANMRSRGVGMGKTPQGMNADLQKSANVVPITPANVNRTPNSRMHEFIKNELNGEIITHSGRAYNDVLLGEKVIIKDTKGNKLDIWVKETPDTIQLSTIGARDKGTGVGTNYLMALKKYSDKSGKKMVVPDITNPAKGYWDKFDWLVDDSVPLDDEGGKKYWAPNTKTYTPPPRMMSG